MTSDKQDESRIRKHQRSSDDEDADKLTKRTKHRHHKHHRHHRRHRHHRSKDEAEDCGIDLDPARLVRDGDGDGMKVDDDVEEGEILEEGGLVEVAKKQLESEAESGEIMDVEFSDTNPSVPHGHVGKPSDGKQKDDNVETVSDVGDRSHRNALLAKGVDPKDESVQDGHANGTLGTESWDEGHKENGASSIRSDKRSYLNDDTTKLDIRQSSSGKNSFSSETSGEKYIGLARSPSDSRYSRNVYAKITSRSHYSDREKSESQSMIEDEANLKRSRNNERDGNRARHRSSSDMVIDEVKELDYRGYAEPHQSSGIFHRERSHKERDWKVENEQEKNNRSDINGDSKKERERKRSKEEDIDGEYRRATDQERSRDTDRDRRRERGRDRSKDRDRDREREPKNRDRAMYHSRENGRRYEERERERRNDRERERRTDREREREKRNDREMERGYDKRRDRDTEIKSVTEKLKTLEDGYGWRDGNKHSMPSKYDEMGNVQEKTRRSNPSNLRSYNHYPEGVTEDKQTRDEDEQDDLEDHLTLRPAEQEEEELNRIKEESRRRRQAILEKYKNKAAKQHDKASEEDQREDKSEPGSPHAASNAVRKTNNSASNGSNNDAATIVAENNVLTITIDPSVTVEKSPPRNEIAVSARTSGATGLGEGTPKSEREDDMFCDDIFGESPAGVRKKPGKGDTLPVVRSGLHDNWDDAEGYYSYHCGELVDGRYEVLAAHGKGVFSTVVRANDLKAGNGEPEEVAIKIIRNNETMHKAGQTEVQILKKLAGADPENRRHCVRFISSFKYRNHLCLVFESLHMNLREVLKKFGRNIGLKLTAVRAYAKQLFIALKHLKNCGVLHSDIKPDNMLVNEAKNVLKLCDFGNAMFAGKNEITPYLVSRFYRAPEIILGLSYDHPIDIWSVGCCLYELYTGKVLFPGSTNNDMLRLHMELKGPFPKKMLRKGAFSEQHFDQDLNFYATEEDLVTQKTIKRMILNIKPKDIGSVIKGYPGEDPKMIANFKDMLDKIFILDPDKRMTVSQALSHPFITGK